MKLPDVESIRRTLQRKGPNCDDFKDGMIRDLSKWTEDLLQYLEALKATQWQPIETAPRDETIVDLWVPDYGRWAQCRWYKSMKAWHTCESELEVPGDPTHWRPEPPPPESEDVK